MYLPRRLRQGPEYKESLAAVRAMDLADLEQNLNTVRGLAKFEPEVATQVKDSRLRIAQVYDSTNGYSLALYFEGEPLGDEAMLLKVAAFEIEPELYPWGI
jgi:hypothetical protein